MPGAPQGPVDTGQVQQEIAEAGRKQREDTQHPAGHHDPRVAAQAGDARVPGAPGHDTAQQGDDPGEQVRHAGQVAEDEIAVEADERQQLLQHLQVRDGDDQEQDLGRGGRVEAGQGQHEDQVEVQATEVGPQPAGPAEPVGVGDVGEERRPDQVDPDADHAGPRTPIAAAGRVSALVESGGDHRESRPRRADPPGRAGPAGYRRPAHGRRTASSPRPGRSRRRPRRGVRGTAAAGVLRRRSPRAPAGACPGL